MTQHPIRAIIFDFGGVLTRQDISDALLRRWDAMLELPVGTLRQKLYAGEAWELASTGKITPEEYWARVGQPYEDRLPPEFRLFRQGVFRLEPIDEAMVRLVQRLHQAYSQALCSNALVDLPQLLEERPDIRDLFDVVVISSQVGLRKPDPAIYELTAKRLGVPITACLLVDDKSRNTVAAEALGMAAIVFESVAQLEQELAELGLIVRQR